jgi:hypothetical protein
MHQARDYVHFGTDPGKRLIVCVGLHRDEEQVLETGERVALSKGDWT